MNTIKELILHKFPNANLEHLDEYVYICNKDNNGEFTEIHHKLSKSLWPEYTDLKMYKWNKVKLTPFNHAKAHYELALAIDDVSAWCAVCGMLHWNYGKRNFDDSDFEIVQLMKEEARLKFRGKNHPCHISNISDELRETRRLNAIKHGADPIYKEKQRIAQTGKKRSSETKSKLSLAMRNYDRPFSHTYNNMYSQRFNQNYYEPHKKFIYDYWIKMGSRSGNYMSRQLQRIGYPDSSCMRPLVKEFKAHGYLTPPKEFKCNCVTISTDLLLDLRSKHSVA